MAIRWRLQMMATTTMVTPVKRWQTQRNHRHDRVNFALNEFASNDKLKCRWIYNSHSINVGIHFGITITDELLHRSIRSDVWWALFIAHRFDSYGIGWMPIWLIFSWQPDCDSHYERVHTHTHTIQTILLLQQSERFQLDPNLFINIFLSFRF